MEASLILIASALASMVRMFVGFGWAPCSFRYMPFSFPLLWQGQ